MSRNHCVDLLVPHPAVRLVLLALFAIGLPLLPLLDLGVVSTALLLLHGLHGRDSLNRVADGLWRLRWLLLAIGVLYAGFTPGQPWLDSAPGLSREGTFEALRRILVLTALLAAVYLLLQTTPLPQLTGAILWLTQPLSRLGFPHRHLALRLALTLDGVAQARQNLQAARLRHPGSLIDAAAAAIVGVEQSPVPEAAIATTPLQRPPLSQWLLPLLLATLLYGLAR